MTRVCYCFCNDSIFSHLSLVYVAHMMCEILDLSKSLLFLILSQPDSLNPFETNNGKFFNSGNGYDQLLATLESKDRDNYSPTLSDDPKHGLVDLRRQVVYLQVFRTPPNSFILYTTSLTEFFFVQNMKYHGRK